MLPLQDVRDVWCFSSPMKPRVTHRLICFGSYCNPLNHWHRFMRPSNKHEKMLEMSKLTVCFYSPLFLLWLSDAGEWLQLSLSQRSHRSCARMLRIRGAKAISVACLPVADRNRSQWGHLRNGFWTGGVQHQQESDQPVRAAGVAHRAVVGGLQHCAGSGSFRQPDCDMDYSGAQANEDCDQLFPSEPGLLWRLDGCFQHAHQLCLRGARRVVLWRGVLQVSQLFPCHCCVRQHLLHDCDSHRQVWPVCQLVLLIVCRKCWIIWFIVLCVCMCVFNSHRKHQINVFLYYNFII